MRSQGCTHGCMRLSLSPSGPLADPHTSIAEVPASPSAASVRRRAEEEAKEEEEAEAVTRFMMQMQNPRWSIVLTCNKCGASSVVLEMDENATAKLIKVLKARRSIEERKQAFQRWLKRCATTGHKWKGRSVLLRSNKVAARWSEGMTTTQLILALNALKVDDCILSKLQVMLILLSSKASNDGRQASNDGWYLMVCNGGAGKRCFNMADEEDVATFYSNNARKVLRLFKLCAIHWEKDAILSEVGNYLLHGNFTRLDSKALRAGTIPDDSQLALLHEPFVGFKIVTARQTVGNCCVHNLLLALQVVYLGYERTDGNYENLQRYINFQEYILQRGLSKLQSLKRAVVKRSNITTYEFVMGTISAQLAETQQTLAAVLPPTDAAQAG